MKINKENYFDPEAEKHYMGSTQFKNFMRCESAQSARMAGKLIEEKSTALMVGSFIDAYFEGTLEAFLAINGKDVYKRDGSLKAEYEDALAAAKFSEKDELFSLLMSGKKQSVKTGKIAGVPYKIKIDSLLMAGTCQKIMRRFPETEDVLSKNKGAIVDLKYIKDFDPIWSDEEHAKIPFIKHYGYDIQGAIYSEIQGNNLPFIIAGISKEKVPTLKAIYIPDSVLEMQMTNIRQLSPRYDAIKHHKAIPTRCGHCDFCKLSNRLSSITNYLEDEDDD